MESRQGAGLYPVGRALRATFDAENHDSLGTDLTGLMLELARIDPDAPAKVRVPPAVGSVPPVAAVVAVMPAEPAAAARQPPWWRRWLG